MSFERNVSCQAWVPRNSLSKIMFASYSAWFVVLYI